MLRAGRPIMHSLAIILFCIVSAVAYGIVHDQITARVCVEYFTIGHAMVFDTQDPTLLGLGWGVIATWWVGLLLGVPLAVAARAGGRPQRDLRSLLPSIGKLLALMAGCALLAGVLGWIAASQGWVDLVGPLADEVPPDKHAPFIADMWAHSASYIIGIVGGVEIIIRVWRSRANSR